MANIVYIATSLDGYIADRNGSLEFLETVPNPDSLDLGIAEFFGRVDALVMGRVTYETVFGFGIEWPYPMPVFVMSTTLTGVPEELAGKVEIVNGELADIVAKLNERGFNDLYIDGGKLIQSFLRADMIDELIVTKIPVLLGGGTPLFADLPAHQEYEHVGTEVYLDALVQSHYKRKR